jgi:1-acyl-sn-glycerol-3-phosphate acyltransferase
MPWRRHWAFVGEGQEPQMSLGPIRRGICRVHFTIAAVLGAISFVFISGLGLIYALIPGTRPHAAMLLARTFHKTMTFLLGWKVVIDYPDRLSRKTPCVFMLGHQSNLDIVIYGSSFPSRTVVIGKREVGKIPVFGWFFRATGNILIDRGNRASAIESIRKAAERVQREQISVWMFPEGHRNQKPELLPFKKGSFHLAIAAQVPIVPVMAEPVNTILDAHHWMARPGRLGIHVYEEIPTAGLTEDDLDGLVERVRNFMQERQNELIARALPPMSS